MRQVDCVTVKGSTKPVGLFTYDVDLSGLSGPLRLSQHHKSVRRRLTWERQEVNIQSQAESNCFI